MGNHWAISIGINQYQHFQPLNYAQDDARAVQSFLVDEAGVPSSQCLLMTDTSSPISGYSTYPNRTTIETWLSHLCQQYLQPGDSLWCFFSGYGVCYQGHDYLVPIEGDPQTIPTTGIAMVQLFQLLRSLTDTNLLVLLDMNRSQGIVGGQMTGRQTVDLARSLEIPTILSCHPDQFSRETADLHHGLFTAALLEGLRHHHCDSIASLDRYLSDRLPQLSDHYWRPLQAPLTIVHPPDRLSQPIFAQNGYGYAVSTVTTSQNGSYYGNGMTNANLSASQPSDVQPLPLPSRHGDGSVLAAVAVDRASVAVAEAMPTASTAASMDHQVSSMATAPTSTPTPNHPVASLQSSPASAASPEAEAASTITDRQFWYRAMLWGGSAMVLLFGGVVLNNPTVFLLDTSAKPVTVNSTATSTANAPANPSVGVPSPLTSGLTANPAGGNPAGGNPVVSNPLAAQPAAVVDPATQQSESVLQKSRQLASAGTVDGLLQAIAQANQIQPNQPLYKDSQAQISQWDQTLIRLMQAQVEQRSFAAAIATAQTVTAQRLNLAPRAQQVTNRASSEILKVAQNLAKQGRFRDAIQTVAPIPPTSPVWTASQQSVDQWSSSILSVAHRLDREGNLSGAIAVASRIPPNTTAYTEGQKQIQKWQLVQEALKKLQPPPR